MSTPESSSWRLQSKQFSTRLNDAVISYTYTLLSPEAQERRDKSTTLAAYSYEDAGDRGRNFHAVSVLVPTIYGSAQQDGETDWVVTLAYDAHNTLVGFRSMLARRTADNEPVTAKGAIATKREGFATALDIINSRTMQLYANNIGRPVTQIVTDDNLTALQNIQWEVNEGISDPEAYQQALQQRPRWLRLYGEGGTMGVRNGEIPYTPTASPDDQTRFYHVHRNRFFNRRKLQFSERRPTETEANSLSQIGVTLSGQKSSIDFPRLIRTLS